ncbi:hypothetical protein GCM10007094_27030 [Pseudovibrio japonicus]|uniref:DUF3887 domain-containing protein n=1 Tax=Pseudovibrio japonicus TaxID=366534 RepID=A0ABQ3EGK3_9HYPH|nr:hypothetical protein [Pseudovibrio japonicus]GHB36016.1 hypothetical protein GCM10007094_27030 [Pseudovibrio japonicus]
MKRFSVFTLVLSLLLASAQSASNDEDELARQFVEQSQMLELMSERTLLELSPIVFNIYKKKNSDTAKELTDSLISEMAERFARSRTDLSTQLITRLTNKFSKDELEQLLQSGHTYEQDFHLLNVKLEFDTNSKTFRLVDVPD